MCRWSNPVWMIDLLYELWQTVEFSEQASFYYFCCPTEQFDQNMSHQQLNWDETWQKSQMSHQTEKERIQNKWVNKFTKVHSCCSTLLSVMTCCVFVSMKAVHIRVDGRSKQNWVAKSCIVQLWPLSVTQRSPESEALRDKERAKTGLKHVTQRKLQYRPKLKHTQEVWYKKWKCQVSLITRQNFITGL